MREYKQAAAGMATPPGRSAGSRPSAPVEADMKTRFFCESCGREVSPTARRCPGCGKNFTSVKCPECGFEGGVADFADGCPSCGYLQGPSKGGIRMRSGRSGQPRRQPRSRPLSRRFYRVSMIVLACLLAGSIGLLVLVYAR